MAKAEILTYINSIADSTIADYTAYWNTITPKTDEDYFNRWRFAFLSVHTSWKSNVRAYAQMDSNTRPTEKQQLQQQIVYSKVGLIKLRTEGMWKFQTDFWANPQAWRKRDDETWDKFRDRTMNMCHGLGYAKTAFAIELCYPNTCEVVCLDTHMLQLYEHAPGTPSAAKYKDMERHWTEACKARNIPSFMVRNVYWDKVQEKTDTRYWSYVFEPKPTTQEVTNGIQL